MELAKRIEKLERELRLLNSCKPALLRDRRKKKISKKDYTFHKKIRKDAEAKAKYREELQRQLSEAKVELKETREKLKYKEREPAIAMIAIMVLMVGLLAVSNYSGITGYLTFTTEETIVQTIDQLFTENGLLELNLTNITSLSISGEIIGSGRARVLLDIDGTLFTVMDTDTTASAPSNLITGMVIADRVDNTSEETEEIVENITIEKASEEVIEEIITEEIIVEEVIENVTEEIVENITEEITIEENLTEPVIENITIEENTTLENITNIVENITIEDNITLENITIETNTTLENITINSTENITIENITIETNVTLENITINTTENVSLENITIEENVTINITENISIDIEEIIENMTINITVEENITLEINVTENVTEIYEFSDECVETCLLEIPGGRLIIELDGVELRIDSITFKKEIENKAPVQIKELKNVTFFNEYIVDGSKYFTDPEGDNIIYDTKSVAEIETNIEKNVIQFTTNNSGTYEMFIYATDGSNLVKSNTFTMRVGIENVENETTNTTTTIEKTTQYQAIIRQPVKWRKEITVIEEVNETIIELPVEADNITVIAEETSKEIAKDKLSVVENKTRKKLEQYETEKAIELIEKALTKEKGSKAKKLEKTLEKLENKKKSLITGKVIANDEEEGFLTRFMRRASAYVSNAEITGRVIEDVPQATLENITINETEEITVEEVIENVTEEIVENITEEITIEENLTEPVIENITIEENTTLENITNIVENITTEENMTTNVTIEENITLENVTIETNTTLENITINSTENITIEENTTTNTTINITENITIEENISESVVVDTPIVIVENVTEPTINLTDIIELLNISDVNVTEDMINLIIEGNSTRYIVNYETAAPQMMEEEINAYKKIVTISSATHYEKVLTFTNITPSPQENIGLYWIQNGSKTKFNNVTYIDSDGDGLIEMLEWIVPHLSNQTFEITITVLNAQSYPMVGGYWTVMLNASGTADLEIIPYNLTTFIPEPIPRYNGEDDLEFEQFSCGNTTIEQLWASTVEECTSGTLETDGVTPCYIEDNKTFVNYTELLDTNLTINISSFKIYDYECNNLSFWTDTVRTPGAHHILFTFGPDNATAHNWAVKNATSKTKNATVSIRRPSGTEIITGAYMLLNHTITNTEAQHDTVWTYNYTKDCQEEGSYEIYVELMSLGNSQTEKDTTGIDEAITYWVDSCIIKNVGHMNCTVHAKSKNVNAEKVFGGRLEVGANCNITSAAGDTYWTTDGQDTCSGAECGTWLEFYHTVSTADQTDETTFNIMCNDGADDNTVMILDINETCGPSSCGEATVALGGYDSCADPTCTDGYTYVGNDTVESLGGFALMSYDIGILDTSGWSTVSTYSIDYDAEQADCDCFVGSTTCDGDSCFNTTGNLIAFPDSGTNYSAQCCGDDNYEFYNKSSYDATLESSPAVTVACCNASSSCVFGSTCYANNTSPTTVDSDSDDDYCLDSTWYDCNSDSDCGSGQTCIANDCIGSSINISFEEPTRKDNQKLPTTNAWDYVNTSITASQENYSGLIDWNQSLVGWWRLEGDYTDKSTYGNDGSCSNCPTETQGARGKGYSFNGVDEYIDSSLTTNLSQNDFTVETWVKIPTGTTTSYAVSQTHTTGSYASDWIMVLGSGNNIFWMRTVTLGTYGDIDDGLWHHLAMVWDQSAGTYEGFVDGLSIGTSGAVSGYGGINSVKIGTRGDATTTFFNGTIDEVKIWNRILSPQEINASYQANNYELYNNFTSLTEGGVYTYQAHAVDQVGSWNATEIRTLTINNRPNISDATLTSTSGNNLTTDNLTVSITTSDPDSDAVTNITDWRKEGTSIAVLNMPFDSNETSTAANAVKDYSTYSNDGQLGGGTAANAPTWTNTGQVGGAYDFDGNDYLTISHSSELEFNGAAFSVVEWCTRETGKRGCFVFKGALQDRSIWLAVSPTGTITGGFEEETSGINILATGGTTFPENELHQIAVTYDGISNITVYYDGASDGSVIDSTNPATNSGDLVIGRDATDGVNYVEGSIDNVRIYNKALSSEQIAKIFEEEDASLSSRTIVSNETSEGDNWTVMVTPNDGFEDGVAILSNTLTIANSAPSIILTAPSNNTVLTQYTNRTPTFTWTATDADEDGMNFTIWLASDSGLTSIEMYNYTDNQYYIPTMNLSVDDAYWWIVEGYDGQTRINSTIWNFTLESYIAIDLTTSAIDFGLMDVNTTKDTDNNASPIIVENTGNMLVNLTIYANSSLWESVSNNSIYYRFKADTSEASAFNTDQSNMSWTNMTDYNKNLLRVFGFAKTADEAQVDIYVWAPAQEAPGQKVSEVVITAG